MCSSKEAAAFSICIPNKQTKSLRDFLIFAAAQGEGGQVSRLGAFF